MVEFVGRQAAAHDGCRRCERLLMGEVVYRAEIPLTRVKGPLRLAEVPAEPEPVRFGTHGAIARHYGVTGEVPDPHATTIDYVIAATGG